MVEENNKSKQCGNHFDLMKRLGVQVECICCRFFHFQIMEFFQPWRKLQTCWNLAPREKKKYTSNLTQTEKPSKKWSSPPTPSCVRIGIKMKFPFPLAIFFIFPTTEIAHNGDLGEYYPSFMVPKDTGQHSLPRYASFCFILG